jgi:aryl-alcohol dehydrogenase-like predicted oxidoreductase
MEYTHLGRSGLSISRLCLGTMNFGPQTPEHESHLIMDAAQGAGINFFDTANVYGWKKGEGVTEKIIGRWFAQGGERRQKTILATKLYGSMSDWPNDTFLSARNIIKACEASLTRLQTDYIDLYQMHHVDRKTPWEEIWQAYETLVQQGKIIYAGSSNFAAWQIVSAQHEARDRHFMGLISEQSHYNLLERTVELEVLPACQQYGIGVIPWSPLGGGLLSGILTKPNQGRGQSDMIQQRLAETRSQIEAYEGLCDDIGQNPAHVGLAWLLAQPAVTCPIVGPRSVEQLANSLHSLEVVLSPETLDRLDQIFPGPKGPAPEAYAW